MAIPQPYVDTRNAPHHVHILIENAPPFATRRLDGSYYVSASLTPDQARALISQIQFRLAYCTEPSQTADAAD